MFRFDFVQKCVQQLYMVKIRRGKVENVIHSVGFIEKF